MNAVVEQGLIDRIRTLSPQQVIEVDDFIEFLASKSKRSTALDRLLAIAPALEAVGAESINEDQISAEVEAARQERWIPQAAKSYHAYRP